MRIPLTNENDIFDMYIIKWEPKSYSYLHLHTDYGCLVKILNGDLVEKRYVVGQHNLNLHESVWKYKNKNYDLAKGTSSYIDNDIAAHRIINPSETHPCFSLHIYGFPKILRHYKYTTIKEFSLPK